MKFRTLIMAISTLVMFAPQASADFPWEDEQQFGDAHPSDHTGKQTLPTDGWEYAFPPLLPNTTTGTNATFSVNPMPLNGQGLPFGIGNGAQLYTGTYAFGAPAGILPPCTTGSMLDLSVVEESGFTQVGSQLRFENPDSSHYMQQQDN